MKKLVIVDSQIPTTHTEIRIWRLANAGLRFSQPELTVRTFVKEYFCRTRVTRILVKERLSKKVPIWTPLV